jgi:histone H3/H4
MAERPEDLNLPSAVVSRIIKDALPPQVQFLISKNLVEIIIRAFAKRYLMTDNENHPHFGFNSF